MSRWASVKCDRCREEVKVKERDEYNDTLPKGWRHLTWSRADVTFGDQADFDLCEACVQVVSDALMRPPRAP